MVQYSDEELDKKLREIKEKDNRTIDEPGFFYKFMGLYTEPGKVFKNLSYFKPNFLNWLIPILVYIFIFSVCEYVMLNNSNVRKTKFENYYQKIENQVKSSMRKGKLTRKEAEEVLDMEYEKAKYFSIGSEFVPTFVFKLVTTFLHVFIVVTIFQFFMNLFFSEIFVFKRTLIIYGLSFIVLVPEVLVRTVIVLLTGSYISVLDFSVFFTANSFITFFTRNINPFVLWFYLILCIGIIKTYRIKNKKKIYFFIFGGWCLMVVLNYFIMQQFAILSKFLK